MPASRPFTVPCLGLLLCCLGALPTGVAAEPLPAVVERVLLQQPTVQSAQALLNAASAQVTQARSDFFPTTSVAYRNANARDETQGRPVDRTIRRSDASLSWNLFNGGADFNRVRSASFARDAAIDDLDDALERVAAEISENYLDVLRLRQEIQSLQATIDRQEALEIRIRQRVDNGRIPPSEGDLMRSRLIQNRSQLGQLRAQLGTAEYRYRLLSGELPGEALIMPTLLPPGGEDNPDALIERIRQNSPGLRAARQRVAAREADIGVARGALFPSVDVQYSQRLANDTNPVPVTDTEHSQEVRINLAVPLGGKNLARHTEARERHRAAAADAEQTDRDLTREASDYYRQWQEARALAPMLEQGVLAAQRVAAAYELQFDAGRRSLNDLSNVQDELFLAQRNLVENRAQQTLLQTRFLRLAGELRQALRTRYQAAPIAPGLLGTTPVEPAKAIVLPPIGESPVGPTPIDRQIAERTASWLADWMAGDYSRYRTYYQAAFRPSEGTPTAAWEAERKQRLANLRDARIRLDQMSITSEGEAQATARFLQHFTSPRYRDSVRKELTWVRDGSVWLISAERSIR